jgi:uncharacterized membrane protein
MVLAAFGDGVYKLLYLGHIVALLVAFAPAVIHPLLSAQAKGRGEASLVELTGSLAANGRRLHFPALVVLGGLGLGLVIVGDNVWGFDQAWVSLALLVWLAMCGVVSGLLLPAERKLAAGDLAAERQVALGGQITTVLLLVMLYLMIWKPGA